MYTSSTKTNQTYILRHFENKGFGRDDGTILGWLAKDGSTAHKIVT